MFMNTQKGFTLIELMIVVAIIGILAAIAIPAYQNYIAKTQVTRVLGEISSMKTAIETNMLNGEDVEVAADLGYVQSSLVGTANTDLVVATDPAAGTATVTAILGNKAAGAVTGAKIILARDKDAKWTCTIDPTAASTKGWKDSYIPTGCVKKA